MQVKNIRPHALGAAFGFLAASALVSHAVPRYGQSDDSPITAAQLKSIIEGLGYEAKELNSSPGKEKYEFTSTKGGLDIPVAAEISASKNYVWLTVFLKDQVTDSVLPASRFHALLKRNSKIQPSQFYITESDRLMCAIALDNRGVTAPVLRRNVDKLTSDVAESKSLWE